MTFMARDTTRTGVYSVSMMIITSLVSTEIGYTISKDDLNHGTGKLKDSSIRALGERTGIDLQEASISIKNSSQQQIL